jgi:ATP/maltotriose-dependent transcriptional regulator MalT
VKETTRYEIRVYDMIDTQPNQKPKLRGQRKTLVLPRAHLTQKVLNPDFDVVLIMSPIGYGKKTLMGQLEAQMPNPIVLTLDVDDSNPFTLISHIRTQLEAVIDFAQPAFDPSVATVNHLIAVIEALDKTERDLQFFFHGSHVLNNSSAQLLERFIVKLPAGHKVFISGFNTSNLSLSEVYVSARVLTLEGHDLLLGLEEVTQMLNVFNSGLDAQQVFEKSGGVVSLVFVMANTNSLEAVSFEQFIENILNELPKDILSFLEKMSVFEVWNEETIAALKLEAPKNWVEKVLSYGNCSTHP